MKKKDSQKPKASKLANKFKVLTGFNFGANDERKDKGEVVTLAEIGEGAATYLLSEGAIEAID